MSTEVSYEVLSATTPATYNLSGNTRLMYSSGVLLIIWPVHRQLKRLELRLSPQDGRRGSANPLDGGHDDE